MIRLLFTSGRGPAECRIALTYALAHLQKEAEVAGVDCDIAEGPHPDRHGPGSALVLLSGEGAATLARAWTGSVLWIAKSPVRPTHKRKNWFIGVLDVGPPPAVAAAIRPGDVTFQTFTAGGPGGQHQNKTESAVRATHLPTGLATVSRAERSQHRNKAVALARLASLIASGGDLARLSDDRQLQAGHDSLERGRPVRTFRGSTFKGDRCAAGT
jgi:peptide chain release factor